MLQMIITESLVILEIKEKLLARHLSVLKGCLPLSFIFRQKNSRCDNFKKNALVFKIKIFSTACKKLFIWRCMVFI